ncbi:MAG: ATPase [Blastocatellia bacterium]|nr:MAG: ATPase [Blastocatellia bacterium]
MAVSSVANSDTFKTTTPSDREIVLTRLFDAPRSLVFDAMTKPEHVRRWWGILDDKHSVPVCEIDLRIGGAWRFVGRGPHGDGPEFYGVYREIVPPDRLVFTEIYAPFPDVESVVTSLFTEEGGKTRLTVTALYPSIEVRDMVLKSGMEKGAALSYDRLEDLVRELQRRG